MPQPFDATDNLISPAFGAPISESYRLVQYSIQDWTPTEVSRNCAFIPPVALGTESFYLSIHRYSFRPDISEVPNIVPFLHAPYSQDSALSSDAIGQLPPGAIPVVES